MSYHRTHERHSRIYAPKGKESDDDQGFPLNVLSLARLKQEMEQYHDPQDLSEGKREEYAQIFVTLCEQVALDYVRGRYGIPTPILELDTAVIVNGSATFKVRIPQARGKIWEFWVVAGFNEKSEVQAKEVADRPHRIVYSTPPALETTPSNARQLWVLLYAMFLAPLVTRLRSESNQAEATSAGKSKKSSVR